MSTATEIIERNEGRTGLASMIRRVKIHHYKSIKNCDVELGPFTILVGRNGSGKSSFLDAMRVVSHGLRGSLDEIPPLLSPWNGLAVPGSFHNMQVVFEVALPDGTDAEYSVSLCPPHYPIGGWKVHQERLTIRAGEVQGPYYNLYRGDLTSSVDRMPPASDDRLYLIRASAAPEFRPMYDALTSMSFHDLSPQSIKESPPVRTGGGLARSGVNLASAFEWVELTRPTTKQRILDYLRLIDPDIADVRCEDRNGLLSLVFDRPNSWHGEGRSLYLHGMSDGTLRALGILVAINQLAADGRPIRLVGIEEPETALHPAASAALMGALRSAATHTQILVTTHGSDLLDCYDPEEDHLLLATMSGGATRIAPIDEASRIVLAKHLDTAGGLLRMDQFEPDLADLERQDMSARATGRNGDA